ncbi:hypothetical protein C8Q80DRAFT_1116003 [Daedaleopsis nitida]|nr:hypothetical protein C8Q80DRAFT_1116003 [Daedaleopsis nitida]
MSHSRSPRAPSMDRRGRSRDVSPIALVRYLVPDSDHLCAQTQAGSHLCACSLSPAARYPSSKPSLRDARDSPEPSPQPVASSSRLPPPPSPLHQSSSLSTSPSDTIPRTHSSSSVFSDASEQTPLGPLTPPDADQSYALERPLDYYDSPPSPPRSLQDQMHVAYALENMHLAKILLLKLRGIEVSGDDDPRIAAVRDEDFSSSFVPEGGLRLDADAEARVQEAERRAREARKRRAREERLRQCERVWEYSLLKVRGERERAAREREQAHRDRRERERREKERERERARKAEAARAARGSQLRIASAQSRQLVCYDSLRNADARFPKPAHANQKVDDSSMFLRSPTDKELLSLPRAQRDFVMQHAKSISRSVPFSDVLTAMHGPLFAEDEHSRSYAHCRPHQADLLAILLEPVDKAEEKGNPCQDILPARRIEKVKPPTATRVTRSSTMESVSSTSSETSSSVSTVTRSSGSWFSFASKSSFRSTSTALTTPSSSPLTPTKSSTILSGPLSSSPSECSPSRARRQSSRPPVTPTVLTGDHPLALPAPPKLKRKEPLAIGRGRPLIRRQDAANQSDDLSPPLSPSSLVHRVSRSVTTIIDFASQFQRAYVKAAMFSAGVDLYGGRSPSRSLSRSPSRSPARVRCASKRDRFSGRLRPQGYRVCSLDVHVFTAVDESLEDEVTQYQRTLIPLSSPSGGTLPVFERVFPLPPPLPRSPFRPQYQPGTRLPRMRPVANPIILRLQALHNICQSHALTWHRARDGSMAAGKEKMIGVAWEGIGQSSLGWQVSSAH